MPRGDVLGLARYLASAHSSQGFRSLGVSVNFVFPFFDTFSISEGMLYVWVGGSYYDATLADGGVAVFLFAPDV